MGFDSDEILTRGHVRNFIQWGGPSPDNQVLYYGVDAQYLTNTGVSNPEIGSIDPIWVADPYRQKRFRSVNRSIPAPDLPASTVTMLEKHGSIPRQLLKIGCMLNLYDVGGKCGDLSDFLSGWSDYVMIYSQGLISDKDLGDRSAWDTDEMIEDALSVTWSSIYPIGQLSFGEKAASMIDRSVVDVTYATSSACGKCSYGDAWIYALTASSGSGSPGLPPEIVYSVDGGLAFDQVNIDGMGTEENVYAIRSIGKYLIVLGEDAYYYSTINAETGVPGSFTKVSTGFVAAGSPKDLYIISPREIYFCGDGGYIYKSTNIQAGVSVIDQGSATTEDLVRIKGYGSTTIIAVGNAGAIVISFNRGATWGTTTTTPTGVNLNCVDMSSDSIIWVGSAFPGRVFRSLNKGETWTEYSFPDAGEGEVTDITVATSEVLYIATYDNTPTAKLWTSWNGGADFTKEANRIISWPVFDRINKIALPATDDPGHRSNTIALAGIAGNGIDGILLQGYAGRE